MQTLAWILLVITSLSLIVRQKGTAFGLLFFASVIIGFIAFGFVGGIGYLALLFLSSLVFYLIERFLSVSTAVNLAKKDVEKESDSHNQK